MIQSLVKINSNLEIDSSVKETLRKEIEGDVRFDDITREIYSTDASIYRMLPICVVIPKTVQDVKTIIQIAHENKIPILPRGGGSSLSGQTVNHAIVIDFSKYLNRVLDIDTSSKTVKAQPGLTIDVLNNHLKKVNLLFSE